MARIAQCMDPSELGSTAAILSIGCTQFGGALNSGPITSPFHDLDGNGGVYSIELRPAGGERIGFMFPTLPVPVSSFYRRFHFYTDTFGNQNLDSYVCSWFKNGTELGSLRLSHTAGTVGQLKLFSGGSQIAISTSTLAINTWYTIEVGVTIGNSGTYEVRVDGVSAGWIPAGVGDTQPGSDTNVNQFSIESSDSGGVPTHLFDDHVADDSAFPGEGFVTIHSPTANGDTIELTPSTPPNWSNVDEVPYSDADYNQADVAGQEDLYAVADLPGSAAVVRAVAIVARVARIGTEIGSGTPVVKSGGTVYQGTTHLISVTPSGVVDLFEHDPHTSAPWSVAAVNALQIGIHFDA